jgi:RsiW-degrading membrane proteinase PrsW (M82 family)
VTAQPASVSADPHWGEQTSFFQRHQPAFWLFLIVLAITGLDFLSQQLTMISAAPTAWLVTIMLLVPYAIPVIGIIYYLDLYEREPVSILVAAFLWGGIAATTLAMYTNTPLMEVIYKVTGDANFTNEWSAALTAPFVEELYKGLAVVLLVAIARNELDDVLDGFVWGAMVGVGFLLVEDVLYFVRAFAETGSMGTIFEMFMIRILGAGPYSHFLYSGLVGMGIAYYVVRTDRTKGNRILAAIGLIAAGVGAHFFWNSPLLSGILGDGGIVNWLLFVTVKGMPALIGLVLVVRLASRRESRWFAHGGLPGRRLHHGGGPRRAGRPPVATSRPQRGRAGEGS